MRRVSSGILAMVGAATLAACASDSSTPLVPDSPTFDLSVAEAAGTTGNLFVVFESSRVPAGFAAQVADLGGAVEISLDRLGAASVSGLDEMGAAALAATEGIRFVEPELQLHVTPVGEPDAFPMVGSASPAGSDPSTAFFYPHQWHLHAIQARQAWAAGRTGSPSVTVAILDTGIDYLHADLAGLVDLDRSISMLPQDDALLAVRFPGAHPIADLHYHGTHVAATVSSNGIAAAGVTSGVTLIGVKVCSVYGGCPGAAIFGGLIHAAENGADIINMSLGGNFQKSMYPGYVSVVNRALNQINRQGVTVVVSAGNSAIDMDHDSNMFKTYCDAPNVICVSATGPTAVTERDANNRAIAWENVDALATYSNYGRSAVDVAAPGGNVGGGVMAACSGFSLVVPVCQTGTYVITISGTSMASPHAAGVAALIVENVGKNRPGQVRSRMHQLADKIGDSGNDPRYGKGRVNAFRAATGR
jgi:lantibiotic leader peptide-processing serine protease